MLSSTSPTLCTRPEPPYAPNLFLVGAPKCGTTALARYLTAHDEVFVAPKELNYFGTDLEFRTRRGARWHIGKDAYLAWFEDAGDRAYRGDHSVFYLFSQRAASEILEASPSARVVVMLRNPVDQMYSQHGEMLYQGDEDLRNFSDALEAEEDRRCGRRIPPGCQKVFGLFYRELARYSPQVERYFDVFGRSKVHVGLYEDLASDPERTYREVLDFLGVAPGPLPEFEVVNPSKQARSHLVMKLLHRAPSGVRRAGRALVRDHHRRAAFRRKVHAMNTRYRPRPVMDPALRRSLEAEFAPEVERLSRLLGRELDAWAGF